MALELVFRANFLDESAKAKISNQTAFRHPGVDPSLTDDSGVPAFVANILGLKPAVTEDDGPLGT